MAEPMAPAPQDVVFMLAPRLTLMAFAAAIEPLRLANYVSGRQLYRWRLVSETGEPVACSNGVIMAVDGPLEDVSPDAIVLVAAGLDPHPGATRPVMTWLRRQARRGVKLGALCTGSYFLAKAGLLEGRRCTIHWENKASLLEEFPDLEITGRLYEIDRGRLTCAGGAAAADMMLALISEAHGPDLAGAVADVIIHTPVRVNREDQRLSTPARIGVRHPKLIGVIRAMEETLEEPVSPAELAEKAGMSTRQLERLFRRYLNLSPKRYYMELRLKKARALLLQTDMAVIDVALACGFASPSHFSKCYRTVYGRTPYRERGAPPPPPAEGAA